MPTTHGTAWIDTVDTALGLLLIELLTDLSAVTPTLSYSYPRHVVAKLQLPAVTRQCVKIQAGGENDRVNARLMVCTFSIRLHVGYGNDSIDGQQTMRLCNSVVNKVFANFDVMQVAGTTLVAIGDVRPNQTFADSDSIGAEVEVTYMIEEQYTQEA